MATKKTMDIEDIRSTERSLFWIERFASFLLVIFATKTSCFHAASFLFLFTNVIYLLMFIERLFVRPYPFDVDVMFYVERMGISCLAFYYTSSDDLSRDWLLTAIYLVISNVMYVILIFEPKLLVLNLQVITEADDEHLQEPEEVDSSWEEKIIKRFENLIGLGDCRRDPSSIAYDEQETAEIEDKLDGESLQEEEAKKTEDIHDGELLETHESSNGSSEKSWEGIEEKDAIDKEDELLDIVAMEETWECVEMKNEETKRGFKEEELACFSTGKVMEYINLLQEMNHKLEEEKEKLSAKLEAARKSVENSFYDVLRREHLEWEEEKKEINCCYGKLQEENDLFSEINNELEGEKRDLTARLGNLTDSLNHCRAEQKDCEDECLKLREEKEELEEMNHKLEEDKRDLSAKLEALNDSLELYRGMHKDYEEERSKWNVEKGFLTESLEASRRCTTTWDKEREDLIAKLADANSCYQYYAGLHYELSANILSAPSYHQASYNDAEDRCLKLRAENLDLSSKLSTQTSLTTYYRDLLHNSEGKCRRLEEEKSNLNSKLCAEQASAELYRLCMRNFDP